ncbi:MAG: hypothetical protein ACRYG8_01490 [Janthinobacterium lividum]
MLVETRQRADWLTMAGWGLLLMPLLTMWHEIGGHAAACAVQGGHVATIGAFYVECTGLSGWPNAVVACAGVVLNAALSLGAHCRWRRARGETARLVLWLVWVSEAFVATGYFCFSGVTGAGDLGTGAHGELAGLPMPLAWRLGEVAVGVVSYVLVVRAGIAGLSAMLGTGAVTRPARRRIAHAFYFAAGLGAVLVGVLNPVGLFVTIMSAAASSFGGLAGYISLGFAARGADAPLEFVVARDWAVVGGGVLVLTTFAIVLGPSVRL